MTYQWQFLIRMNYLTRWWCWWTRFCTWCCCTRCCTWLRSRPCDITATLGDCFWGCNTGGSCWCCRKSSSWECWFNRANGRSSTIATASRLRCEWSEIGPYRPWWSCGRLQKMQHSLSRIQFFTSLLTQWSELWSQPLQALVKLWRATRNTTKSSIEFTSLHKYEQKLTSFVFQNRYKYYNPDIYTVKQHTCSTLLSIKTTEKTNR